MSPTGVGSGETTLLSAAHTAGDTSQSTQRNFSVASAVPSSASGVSPPTAGGEAVQRDEQNELRTAGEVFSVFSAREDPAPNNLNNYQTTQR